MSLFNLKSVESDKLDAVPQASDSQYCSSSARAERSQGAPVATTFTAPELELDRIPALLGLKSLSGMRALMDMDAAHPRLIVPGPGGIRFECSPGTVVYPLEPTHSGHLFMPCSDFARRPGGETISLVSEVHEPTTTTTTTRDDDDNGSGCNADRERFGGGLHGGPSRPFLSLTGGAGAPLGT